MFANGTAPRGLLEGRDPPSAWPPPAHFRSNFESATVTDVIPETPDAVTLRLRRSSSESFAPGQHFNVEVPTGGSWPAVEAYSVASSPWPDPRVIDLTVKEVPGGRVSPVLVRQIPVGATLAIEGPLGYLTWSEADGGPLALVAGGSGIVPLMSIIRHASAKELRVPIRLLYSSRNRAHSIFQEELGHLAELNPWLKVFHAFTSDAADPVARYHRRVDQRILEEVFADMAGESLAYVCGPFGLTVMAEAGLAAVGVKPGRLFSQNWE